MVSVDVKQQTYGLCGRKPTFEEARRRPAASRPRPRPGPRHRPRPIPSANRNEHGRMVPFHHRTETQANASDAYRGLRAASIKPALGGDLHGTQETR